MQYVYLVGTLLWVVALCVCLVLRRDLIRVILPFGLLGSALGLLSEIFYFHDYWRPPTTMGVAHGSPEDIMFGFSVTAVSVLAYPFLRRQTLVKSDQPKYLKLYCLMLALAFVTVAFTVFVVGVNSIIATIFACLAVSLVVLRLRPDLLVAGFYSSLLVALLALIIYVPLFTFWAPDFWDRYWLLNGTALGVMLPGNIPLSEMVWYVASAFAAGVSYPFVIGKRFKPAK